MKRKGIIFCGIVVAIVMSCLLLTGCYGNNSTEYDIVKQTKMENFELLNKSAKHNQVVFIGDSIIELYPTYELFANNSLIFYNRGISGDTSDKMLERLDKNCLNINPMTVMILIGTNDIQKEIDHSVILKNIEESILKCKQNGVREIIISGLYPVNKPINSGMVGRRTNKEIVTLNAKIQKLTNDKAVTYFDAYSILKDSEGNFTKEYTYDGLHPNAKGYEVITNAIMTLFLGEN